jgi:uncharacterized protein involved in exopolysaccharide biosynthesis
MPTHKSSRQWRTTLKKWQHPLAPFWPACKLFMRSVHAFVIVAVLKTPDSMRWYMRGLVASLAVIWCFAGGYIILSKPSFTSRWTLILPTSSSGISMQVESIGHAQTIPSSPFGSVSLSPKVIYKEIIGSEDVLSAAAERIGLTPGEFGTVRVKLIDETSLMYLEISGRTAILSQKKARALQAAFERQLDRLRADEIDRRADVVNHSLQSYQSTLQGARARILEQQRSTGVLSINQFNEAATSLELMKRKLADSKAEIQRLIQERDTMCANIGMSPQGAAAMLQLSADPAFMKIAGDYADSLSKYRGDLAVMGDANPVLAISRDRYKSAAALLREMTRRANQESDIGPKAAELVMNGTHRSDLVKAIVSAEAAVSGKRNEIRALEIELRKQVGAVGEMSQSVSRLEDLKKDHLLAEAVFTSALARLDTNKTDIYASYPMVQTLTPPSLPKMKTSPSLLMALLFGVGACVLSAAAWGMAWLRHVFLQKR